MQDTIEGIVNAIIKLLLKLGTYSAFAAPRNSPKCLVSFLMHIRFSGSFIIGGNSGTNDERVPRRMQ